MKVPLFAPALLAAGFAAVVATQPAPAQDAQKQRTEALKAFDKLLQVTQNGGDPRTVTIPPLPGVKGNGVDGMVKLWARRYDARREEPTNELVSLETAVWNPGEYFVLCFQSTVTVQFVFANVLVENGVTKLDTLLPNERADFRFSFNPVPAGKVYTMPLPLVMDTEPVNEDVVFGFFTDKHQMLPPPVNPNDQNKNKYKIQAGKYRDLVDTANSAKGDLLKLQKVHLPPPRGNVDNPARIDEVAKLIAITEKGGVERLTLRKRGAPPGGSGNR